MDAHRATRAVWRMTRSGIARPRVAVLGGVHGNERTGIEVLRRLRAMLGGGRALTRGDLILAEGNPEACKRDVRFVDVDLNRCFDTDLRRPGSSGEPLAWAYERRRAAELEPHLRGLDALVDLHATNKPSEPFVRLPGPLDVDHFRRCESSFLAHLPEACSTVLWDPSGHIAAGGMTDEFALRHRAAAAGGAYMCYESGLASDTAAVPGTLSAVLGLLGHLGMLPGGEATAVACRPRAWRHYEIFEQFSLDERGFRWENGHGGKNFGRVPAGEAFARRGQSGPTLEAEEESYIVFPKVETLWAPGCSLGWLARCIELQVT